MNISCRITQEQVRHLATSYRIKHWNTEHTDSSTRRPLNRCPISGLAWFVCSWHSDPFPCRVVKSGRLDQETDTRRRARARECFRCYSDDTSTSSDAQSSQSRIELRRGRSPRRCSATQSTLSWKPSIAPRSRCSRLSVNGGNALDDSMLAGVVGGMTAASLKTDGVRRRLNESLSSSSSSSSSACDESESKNATQSSEKNANNGNNGTTQIKRLRQHY